MPYTGGGSNLADAVQGPGVKASRTVRLRLQPDPNVLDWTRKGAVSNPGECTGEIVLAVGEGSGRLVIWGVGDGELSTSPVKGAELDGDLGGSEQRIIDGFPPSIPRLKPRVLEKGSSREGSRAHVYNFERNLNEKQLTHAPMPTRGVNVP